MPDPFRLPQRQREPFYADVWRRSGLPGKPPPVFAQTPPGPIAGWQPWSNRNVFISPRVMRGLRTLPFPVGRDQEALQVLLHEYAHVAQPRVARPMSGGRNTLRTEPGADLYALNRGRDVARGLHADALLPSGQVGTIGAGFGYPAEVDALTRRPDWLQYVMRGQFGKPVTGIPLRQTTDPRRPSPPPEGRARTLGRYWGRH